MNVWYSKAQSKTPLGSLDPEASKQGGWAAQDDGQLGLEIDLDLGHLGFRVQGFRV